MNQYISTQLVAWWQALLMKFPFVKNLGETKERSRYIVLDFEAILAFSISLHSLGYVSTRTHRSINSLNLMFAITNSNVHVIEDSVSRVNFGDTNYLRTHTSLAATVPCIWIITQN